MISAALLSFAIEFAKGDNSCGDCDQWYAQTQPSYQDELDRIKNDQDIINGIQWITDKQHATLNTTGIKQATVTVRHGKIIIFK